MMFIFLFISLAIVGFVALAAQHRTVRIFAAFYYLVHVSELYFTFYLPSFGSD